MKINKIVKCFSVMLSMLFLCSSFTACDTKQESNPQEAQTVRASLDSFAKAYDLNIPTKRLALVENGKTLYKIVTPKQMSSAVLYAVSELQTFLKEATTISFEIITDEGITYNESAYYISVGATSILEGAGLDTSFGLLGRDGAIVKLCGNQIILGANDSDTDYGFLYAVYDFLEYVIGFKVYADTEIVYTKTNYIPLREYNSVNIPDIDLRSQYWVKTLYESNAYDAARMRLYAANRGMSTMDGSLTTLQTVHNLYTLINPEIYQDQYPEWFSYETIDEFGEQVVVSHGQLCFSNEDLMQELIKNSLAYIEAHPNETILPICINDNVKCCECANCLVEANKYGGKQSGLYLNAINRVAKAFQEDLAGTGRSVDVMLLVYYQYLDAPRNIKAEDNVIAYMAPIDRCYKHSIDGCEINQEVYQTLLDWSKIVKKLAVYDYATDFHNYYLYLNDWNRVKKDMMIYEDVGVIWNRILANKENMVSPFEDLRIWIYSQLAWDSTLLVEDLVDEFMGNYYGAAQAEMQQYYDAWSARYMVVENMADGKYYHQYIYSSKGDFYNQDVLTRTFLNELLALTDKAQDKIKEAGYENSREKLLLDRVEMERFFVIYALMKFYSVDYTTAQCVEYQAYLDYYHNYFGIDYYREGKPI